MLSKRQLIKQLMRHGWVAIPPVLKDYRVLSTSPAFNQHFYLQQYRTWVSDSKLEPPLHYLIKGAVNDLNPNPFFSTGDYKVNFNIDRMNPLTHYLVNGFEAGQYPCEQTEQVAITIDSHAIFDAVWYRNRHMAGFTDKVDPLIHYLLMGSAQGFSPSPHFDVRYYMRQCPDLAPYGNNPLLHYLSTGYKQGFNPNRYFDSAFYLRTNPHLEASGINPLQHYIHDGIVEGRAPREGNARRLHMIDSIRIMTNDARRRPGLYLSKVPTAFGVVKKSGLKGLKGEMDLKVERSYVRRNYKLWADLYDTLSDEDIATYRQRAAGLPDCRVTLLLYATATDRLNKLIASVRTQTYKTWRLFLIADDVVNSFNDKRINVVRELDAYDGDLVVPLDPACELRPHALQEMVESAIANPQASFFYSDHDLLNSEDERIDVHFKPDWNPDLLRSFNYIDKVIAVRSEHYQQVLGHADLPNSYDANLRLTETLARNEIHHIPKVLYHKRPAAPLAVQRAVTMVKGHLKRQGLTAEAHRARAGTVRVTWQVPEPAPTVSIIIPTKDHLNVLQPCVQSVLEFTDYTSLELIIVDNGSTDQATLDYLSLLASDDRVKIIRDNGPFNYSRLNNRAVRAAQGELVCLLNNDVEVLLPDWLSEMVGHALRPDIGAVGAKLLYPDGEVQHAGVITGLGGVAGHPHRYLKAKAMGRFKRAGVTQNISAVTGACLVVRKSVYEEVNGLNEINLTVGLNDVDFCLRLLEAGYHNIYTPHAVLRHHESKSRGLDDTPAKRERFLAERAYMMRRWGDTLTQDKAYNPNLTLDREDFSLAIPTGPTGLPIQSEEAHD